MTDAPIAQTIHDGSARLPAWRRELIGEWLTAHGIRADDVSADHPVLILNVPYRDQADRDDGTPPSTLQVVSFVQYTRNDQGCIAAHPSTLRPLTVQRTVPLKHAFPTDPTPDGEDHGEADRQAAQEAPQEVVRPTWEEGVPDPRQGARPGGPVTGEAARHQGAAEEGPGRRHEAVPQPEEDRRQEVGDA